MKSKAWERLKARRKKDRARAKAFRRELGEKPEGASPHPWQGDYSTAECGCGGYWRRDSKGVLRWTPDDRCPFHVSGFGVESPPVPVQMQRPGITVGLRAEDVWRMPCPLCGATAHNDGGYPLRHRHDCVFWEVNDLIPF